MRSKDYNNEDVFFVMIAHGDDTTILSQQEKSAHATHFKQVKAQQYCWGETWL